MSQNIATSISGNMPFCASSENVTDVLSNCMQQANYKDADNNDITNADSKEEDILNGNTALLMHTNAQPISTLPADNVLTTTCKDHYDSSQYTTYPISDNDDLLSSSVKVYQSAASEFNLVPPEFIGSILNDDIVNKTEIKYDKTLTTHQTLNIDNPQSTGVETLTNHQTLSIDIPQSTEVNENEESSLLGHSSPLPKPNFKSNWRMLADGESNYFWNIDTGITQYETPGELKEYNVGDASYLDSTDSSLADLEGAAFRYASLHLSEDASDHENSTDWSINSDAGKIFSVRSLGWLPLDRFSSDPATCSSEVNACIKHLSSRHGRITDGIGAWGDGKNLLLLIENEYLKLLDSFSQTVLQTQAIKNIRIWGVGGSSFHDFAYVAKDNVTRQYKCHVFRCDASAKAIAHELHVVCQKLPVRCKRTGSMLDGDKLKKEMIALSTTMPIPKAEPLAKFSVRYMGAKIVESAIGIHTIKDVIRDVTTSSSILSEDCTAQICASEFLIIRQSDDVVIVNCRMRYLSFMGIGDDISLFAFINAVGNEAKCHVVHCLPNAAKLASAIQEACMLRFQKAIDSKPLPASTCENVRRQKSFKQYFKNVFTKKK